MSVKPAIATTVTRRYTFEAAHFLPGVPDGHKCKRDHGHNYEIDITITGPIDKTSWFVLDFWDLDKVVDPIVAEVDHRKLNDIRGLENPTAENIGAWFLGRIALSPPVDNVPCLWRVVGVRVFETKNCWADVFLVDGEPTALELGAAVRRLGLAGN